MQFLSSKAITSYPKTKSFQQTFFKLNNIKNIIFDFGGVILNIDYTKTEVAFRELGIENFETQYSQMKQSAVFDKLETGKITEDEFVSAIQKTTDKNIPKDQIITAWNAMLLDLPLRRLQLLQQLQLHYNIYLLSNTNSIHEIAFNKMLKSLTGFNSMGVFFDKVYYSHHIGMRKPDKKIFEFILKENNLIPNETLFIDDSPQHIASAKELGIQTIFLKKGTTIEDDIFKPKTNNNS